MLRPDGRALIADCVLVDQRYEEPFNTHWRAQIGTLDEYVDAARAAGFRLETLGDVSIQAANFWGLSLALMRFEEKSDAPAKPAAPRRDSSRMHAMVRDGLITGGLRHLLLGFGRAAGQSV
jgi:tocopherol O-methyltransferase